MIRFLFGLILGGAVSAIGLGAAAVLNPLPDGPVANMPKGAAAVMAPKPATAEPAVVEEPVLAAASSQPVVEPSAPEVAAVATSPEVAAPAAPAAPSIGGGGTPGFTGSTAPEAASGPGLSSPSIGGTDSGGLNVGSDSSPIRTASAPQVAVAVPSTGAAPSVNTESASVPEVGEVDTTDYAAIVAASSLQAGTALESNAAIFNGDVSKPLMGIVLIDTGEVESLRSGLTALSAPITFGIGADLANSAVVAKGYRDAGFEVVSVIPDGSFQPGMPLELVPEVLLSAMRAVPSATSVVDSINGVVPKDRDVMQVALQSLKLTGHGLLTHSADGDNAVPQFADQAGVRSDVISRVIDAEPGAENISATLEQAVQDARRTGGVIVVGRMSQETVTTLFQWLLGADPRDVTIAPVSVVLR